MVNVEQLQAYYFWLLERGQKYPLTSSPQCRQSGLEEESQPELPGISDDLRLAECEKQATVDVEACRSLSVCETCHIDSQALGKELPIRDETLVMFLTDAPLQNDEEKLFLNVVSALKLKETEFLLRPLTHCPAPTDPFLLKPDKETVASYLGAILAKTKPKLLVGFGHRVAREILRIDADFSAYGGQIHQVKRWRQALQSEREPKNPSEVSHAAQTHDELEFLPTYHPRDMLRFPENKVYCWQHLQPLVKLIRKP